MLYMTFFEEHFTRHHFFRAPHKWIAAFLLSPIHHAEMRYKRHYHLRFSHAKKLFVFDTILLLSTIVLFVASLFWWLYDPTVTALVHLDVSAAVETERLQSGDDVHLTIDVHNQSDVTLTQTVLTMHLPQGFVLHDNTVDTTDNTVRMPLPDIAPDEQLERTVSGRYYGPVHTHESIQTMLIYTQDGRSTPESDIHRLLLSTREPSVDISVDVPAHSIPGVRAPATVTLTNIQDHALPSIDVTFESNAIVWEHATTSLGSFDSTNSLWSISDLKQGDQATLSGSILLQKATYTDDPSWDIATLFRFQDTRTIKEMETTQLISIAAPQIDVAGSWGEPPYGTYGQTSLLALTLSNTGNVPLLSPTLVYGEKRVLVSPSPLLPGTSIPFSLPLVVSQSFIEQGTSGPVFIPQLSFSGAVPGIPQYTYTRTLDIAPLPVQTTLSMTQESRYYTAEGDQLGRGPLPPEVGKETKYWVFTQIKNTVGDITDVSFTTTLAPGAQWTGNASVSKGGNMIYHPETRTATWYAPSMLPYEAIGLYFEVAITPDSASVGSIPRLLTSSKVSGEDPHIADTVSALWGSIEASLTSDTIGSEKGTIVQ